VGVSDYIMGSKSMMFLAQSQRHFELVFDFTYTLVVECCEVWLNYCFWGCGCTWRQGYERV